MPKRRADRLFDIVQILRAGRLVTARAIADRLEVSQRTIYRDIQDLIASGVPIDAAAGSGYLMRPGYDLPPLMFDRSQAMALVVGARMVEAWGGATLASGARASLEKIEAILPDDLRRSLAEIRLLVPGFHVPPELRVRLDQLQMAIDARHVVEAHYRKHDEAEADAPARRLQPLALVFWGGTWTLGAWCELRQDFRTFRVDRFAHIALTQERFAEVPGRGLADYLRHQSGD